jgi:hypothetical protein
MASVPPPKDAPNAYDEAERGTQDVHSGSTTVSAPGSIDEKVDDGEKVKPPVVISSQVVPVSNVTPSKPPAKKVSKWILWTLWFNTYRLVSIIMSTSLLVVFLILPPAPAPLTRKLFTFVVTLNMVGLVLAASGHFPYALRWTSAMALGNLNFAVLMRNELFGRFLYLFVNTCFAKVTISIFWPIFWDGFSLFISGRHYGGDLAARLYFRYFNSLLAGRMYLTIILQHLGGIHSGCALSGTAWLLLKVVNNFRHHSVNPDAILVIGTLTNIALIISALSAFPWIRNTHHK